MNTFAVRLRRFLMDTIAAVVGVWAITILILQSSFMLEDLAVRGAHRQLRTMAFTDFVRYYAIVPASKQVFYGAPARWRSDFEVLESVERIAGGVRVDWDDALFCDHNPHDSKAVYDFYREAEPTGHSYLNPVPRKDMEIPARGYPLLVKRGPDYYGQLPPILYPDHDANCHLRSVMKMTLPGGIIKRFEMTSADVEVRGVIYP